MLEPVGLGLEREQERLQLARRLAQAQLDIAQLASCARELRRQVLERRDGALGGGGEAGGAASLLGGKRLGRLGRALRELGHVPQSLALLEQRGLRPGLQPVGVLGKCAQLREPRLGRGCVPRQLLVPAARGLERAPRRARGIPAGQLLGADERVQYLELIRGPRQPALLELAGHRDEPLAERRQLLARHRAAPGIGARPSLGGDPAGQHQTILVLWPQLADGVEAVLFQQPVGEVELGLDVSLGRARPDVGSVPLGAEQQARPPARGWSCRRPSRP